MESSIYKSVADELEKFKQETGVSPKYISVSLQEAIPIGKPIEYMLARVDVDLDIN